jgi:hypothetical protein
MKLKQGELKSIKIVVTLKDGKVMEVVDPKTMILAYHNLDVKDIGKNTFEIDKKNGDGGGHIFGTDDNVFFALLTLMDMCIERLGIAKLAEAFRTVVSFRMDDVIDEEQEKILESVASSKKKKVIN